MMSGSGFVTQPPDELPMKSQSTLLLQKKKEMAAIIEDSKVAYQRSDRAMGEMVALKQQVDKEKAEFEREWRDLGKLMEQDRQLREQLRQVEVDEVKHLLLDADDHVLPPVVLDGDGGRRRGGGRRRRPRCALPLLLLPLLIIITTTTTTTIRPPVRRLTRRAPGTHAAAFPPPLASIPLPLPRARSAIFTLVVFFFVVVVHNVHKFS